MDSGCWKDLVTYAVVLQFETADVQTCMCTTAIEVNHQPILNCQEIKLVNRARPKSERQIRTTEALRTQLGMGAEGSE